MSIRIPRRKGEFLYGTNSRDIPPLSVRIPPEVLQHIDRAATANFRSRSAEIIWRLIQSTVGESFDEHGCIVRHAAPAGNASADPTRGGQS